MGRCRLIPQRAGRRDWWKVTAPWRVEETVRYVPIPYVTACLIIANVFAFSYELAQTETELNEIFHDWGIVPSELVDWFGSISFSRQPLTVFTSAFLHADVPHIVSNMLVLWFLGRWLERLLVESFDAAGYFMFAAIYFLSILGSAALQVGLTANDAVPIVGASGGIAGIGGAYLMTEPKGAALLVLWFASQALSGIATLGVDTTVAYYGHIGGFVTGCIAMLSFSALALRARGA